MRHQLLLILLSALMLAIGRPVYGQTSKKESPAPHQEAGAVTKRPAADSAPGHLVYGQVIQGDTVMHIDLPQVTIIPPFEFKSRWQRRRYSRLVRYVKKVYPYSQMIKNTYYQIEQQLDTIHDERERKKFIKRKEKELRSQFENRLTKLTILQGRILLKLVDRETGNTTYQVLEQYKGKLPAIFWQSVARIFGSNLKEGYDARGDERMIEDIIVRIENGQL